MSIEYAPNQILTGKKEAILYAARIIPPLTRASPVKQPPEFVLHNISIIAWKLLLDSVIFNNNVRYLSESWNFARG